jgi:hypothetical protein
VTRVDERELEPGGRWTSEARAAFDRVVAAALT